MSDAAPLKTSLYDWHAANSGRIVEFGGWSMPVLYTNIVDEHLAVRKSVGLFDIGHMGRLDFAGPDAGPWLDFATTNDVARLSPGQIQYSLMLNEGGGVIDDILVYRQFDHDAYSVVCNASNRGNVVAQFQRLKGDRNARMIDRTLETAMIALQGPRAMDLVSRVTDAELASLPYYHHTTATSMGETVSISRTGYTGEDGFELILPAEKAQTLWETALAVGADLSARACGLGARDTLRFEAAMPLYGHEMDHTVNPYEAGLGWAVKLAKGEFAGRSAAKSGKASPARKRVGLALDSKRIARQGSVVSLGGRPVGVVTSGTSSPTLGKSLAMALIENSGSLGEAPLTVDVRGHAEPARIVAMPFYRRPVGT